MKTAWILVLAALLAAPACGKKKDESKEAAAPKVDWPAKPADGTPVATVFQKMVTNDRDGELEATIRFFNFTDKTVVGVHGTMHYFDASGKEIKDFPMAVTKRPTFMEPHGWEDRDLGAFTPKETTKIEFEVKGVEYDDKTEWKRPDKQEGAAPAPTPSQPVDPAAPSVPAPAAPAPGGEAPPK